MKKIEREPLENTGDILRFKKPDPYPLKDFYRRNGITGRQITKALGLSTTGHLGNEMNGFAKMPPWIDRKLRATALHLNETRKVILYQEERSYCEKGPAWESGPRPRQRNGVRP